MINQEKAFEKFSKLKVGALFMKMGSGKTKVAIDIINHNICNIDIALFVAPNSTLNNLNNEIKNWDMKCEYILTSYENISQSKYGYANLLAQIENRRVFIIADESIFIKNENTIRFNRLLNIRKKCKYALILNGTPLTKTEWDLYNQMYFLSPLIINMSRNEFLYTFFKHVRYKKRGEHENNFYTFSEINAKYLTNLISPYVFYADLEVQIEESEKEIVTFYNNTTLNNYEKQKLKLLKNLGKKETILGNLQLLIKIAADDELKAKIIANYAQNKQIIIYCQFISEARKIKRELDNQCYIILGKTKKRERKKIIEQFKRNSKPLIMTFGVGSFGLNLQFCNEMIYSSLSFDYGKFEQSKYRIKRIGQTKKINYTIFKTGLSIEKLVEECISRKTDLSAIVKGEIENWKKYI